MASEAADSWVTVLDKLEASWKSGIGPIPPLWMYMRSGALHNILGRVDEAKVIVMDCQVAHAHSLTLRWGAGTAGAEGIVEAGVKDTVEAGVEALYL